MLKSLWERFKNHLLGNWKYKRLLPDTGPPKNELWYSNIAFWKSSCSNRKLQMVNFALQMLDYRRITGIFHDSHRCVLVATADIIFSFGPSFESISNIVFWFSYEAHDLKISQRMSRAFQRRNLPHAIIISYQLQGMLIVWNTIGQNSVWPK